MNATGTREKFGQAVYYAQDRIGSFMLKFAPALGVLASCTPTSSNVISTFALSTILSFCAYRFSSNATPWFHWMLAVAGDDLDFVREHNTEELTQCISQSMTKTATISALSATTIMLAL